MSTHIHNDSVHSEGDNREHKQPLAFNSELGQANPVDQPDGNYPNGVLQLDEFVRRQSDEERLGYFDIGVAPKICSVYSAKGGVGTSTVAALLALARQKETPIDLVDFTGEQIDLLDLERPPSFQAERSKVQLLSSIEVKEKLSYRRCLIEGDQDPTATAAQVLDELYFAKKDVVIDCGNLNQPSAGIQRELTRCAQSRLLVVRCCYLCLANSQKLDIEPTGVIMLKEPGRVLGLGDVESVINAPVVATISIDSSVARLIDSGFLKKRAPRRLLETFASIQDEFAHVA